MGIKREQGRGTEYTGDNTNYISFPMGGMGAGMFCIEGNGAPANFAIKHRPAFNQPCIFSSFAIKGLPGSARVLEGAVPRWKIYGGKDTGNGLSGTSYGLPRCQGGRFFSRFPFCCVNLKHPSADMDINISGWSPFIPGDSYNSSLPVAALEYSFVNNTSETVEGVYSFHSVNFIAEERQQGAVKEIEDGFVLCRKGTADNPRLSAFLSVSVPGESAKVNCRWFRGGWFDPLTMLWKDIEKTECMQAPPLMRGEPSPGGSIYVDLKVPAGSQKTVKVLFAWYVPDSDLRVGNVFGGSKNRDGLKKGPTYKPWYSGQFKDIQGVAGYWKKNYSRLKKKTALFTDTLYKTSLYPEVVEAVSANLSILKSPTVMRQKDGKLWLWEGCCDSDGCCYGSCTHVWNYAQAVAHLFPDMERSLRHTEFNENQDKRGHQDFRAFLPVRPTEHTGHAASDGQLGGIMKVYREWRISGDAQWLREMWPKVKKSIDYCIETWDPRHKGILEEPHHNTYDIEFWGPDGMCGSFYLGALKAAGLMAQFVGDSSSIYNRLYDSGKRYLEEELFNGDYFYQQIRWNGLSSPLPWEGKKDIVPELLKVMRVEGPRYQYGNGCLTDGVLGDWIARVCGLGGILDSDKIKSHLAAVYNNNFRSSLVNHVNTQRPGFGVGDEGGLLLCSWPGGDQLSLPFPYSNELWTGCEYHAASHFMMNGMVREAVRIVKAARHRYDGKKRNPFDEYECGHWYGRALSSYGLFQGLTGIRYDAVEKTLYINPSVKGDFACFFSASGGYGLAGIKGKKPFVQVCSGKIDINKIEFKAY